MAENTVWVQKETGRSTDPYYYEIGEDGRRLVLTMPVSGNTWGAVLIAGSVRIEKILWLKPGEGLETAKAEAIRVMKEHISREVNQWTGIQKIFNELVPDNEMGD